MAEIYNLEAQQTTPSESSKRSRAAGAADIIIFPGVRYERQVEETVPVR